MSLAAIRTQIKTILAAVSGVGTVHDYERYGATVQQLKALYVSNNQLHGWSITRDRTASVYRTNVQTERRHHFVLRGYYALDDSAQSELTFQALVEAIEVAFRTNDTLNNTAEVAGPLQVVQVGPVMFAGVLCHYAELTLEAQELVT